MGKTEQGNAGNVPDAAAQQIQISRLQTGIIEAIPECLAAFGLRRGEVRVLAPQQSLFLNRHGDFAAMQQAERSVVGAVSSHNPQL